MAVSQKSQYGLRAIFELAKHHGQGVTTIAHIAAAQDIPPRFLEQILGQLRQGGFVESHRGPTGGYVLAVGPEEITVGQIIRFIDGPTAPVRCVDDPSGAGCSLHGRCVFVGLWLRVRDAIDEVYDGTTIADLVAQEQAAPAGAMSYCI